MGGLYFYRNEVIKREGDQWIVIGYFQGLTIEPILYKTLDNAKNAIDKNLGGYSGRCMPNRWLKDEILMKRYEEYRRS